MLYEEWCFHSRTLVMKRETSYFRIPNSQSTVTQMVDVSEVHELVVNCKVATRHWRVALIEV